ncbi:hypothetical protein M2G46_22440 [Vibrio vulnificus]|nr:hypothetical protein [Vibrio vulnificus]
MLNQVKSVGYGFLCSLGFSVWCLSASWLFGALFFGLLFFGARKSENCLIQFSGKSEVRAAGSIRNPFLGLQTSNQFCLLFLNQSRVNLVSRKT